MNKHPSDDLPLALSAVDVDRKKFYRLQAEEKNLERQLNETAPVRAPREDAAERYLDTNLFDERGPSPERQKLWHQLGVVRAAIRLQRTRMERSEAAVSRAASIAARPEHQARCKNAVLALIGAIARIEDARAIEGQLEAAGTRAVAIIPPVSMIGLGTAEDRSARWAYWARDLLQYAGVSLAELTAAAGDHWPAIERALHLDADAPRKEGMNRGANKERATANKGRDDDWAA